MEKHPTPTPTFGETIRTTRQAAGLSLATAADEAGISKSLLRFWEVDHVSSPELGAVMRLAAVLELDPLDLAERSGYELRDALPPVQPYLRSKYPDLPEAARDEIAAVVRKYGINPERTGPAPGEDEI